jgi:hypothetical protein
MVQSAMNGNMLRFEMESAHGLLLDLANRKWGLCGLPYDCYELHDLGHPDFPGDQYKALIFVNCSYIPASAAEGVRRWQKDGRTFVWTFGAGVIDEERFDPAMNAGLIGIRLGCQRKRRNIHVCMGKSKHPLVRGGSALDFGTEGSVGPVFYADDPRAQVLGRLRDGGEPGLAVRKHKDWTSVYVAMLNFGPAFLRNIARFAGAHVWCTSDDVVYANRSMVCLHTATKGRKTVRLPAPAVVTDLWTGKKTARPVRKIELAMPAYRTAFWRTEYSETGKD